jgi:hypothetical protein
MSNVSTSHNVNPFVAGKSAALTGQRLARVIYKTTKNQKAKFPAVCVSVPVIEEQTILDSAHRLIPYIRGLMESAQDGIIRSLYETKNGSLSSVHDDEIGVDAIVGYLVAEASGNRLTKELIESWFDTAVADNLTVVVAEKLGFEELNDEQMLTVQKQLNGFKGLVSSLAGGKTILSAVQITGCRKVIALASVDGDEVSERLTARLDAMERKETKLEELLEL